eukprot:5958917-Prymnesium_polylepis.1
MFVANRGEHVDHATLAAEEGNPAENIFVHFARRVACDDGEVLAGDVPSMPVLSERSLLPPTLCEIASPESLLRACSYLA